MKWTAFYRDPELLDDERFIRVPGWSTCKDPEDAAVEFASRIHATRAFELLVFPEAGAERVKVKPTQSWEVDR